VGGNTNFEGKRKQDEKPMYIELRISMSQNSLRRQKRPTQNGGHTFTIHVANKGLITGICIFLKTSSNQY
jgi:hypothetical protein